MTVTGVWFLVIGHRLWPEKKALHNGVIGICFMIAMIRKASGFLTTKNQQNCVSQKLHHVIESLEHYSLSCVTVNSFRTPHTTVVCKCNKQEKGDV